MAIGADNSRCLVHKNFRCILIVERQKLPTLDAALLNRFEKQLFTEELSVNGEMLSVIHRLGGWLQSLQLEYFKMKQMFPTINERQSLS